MWFKKKKNRYFCSEHAKPIRTSPNKSGTWPNRPSRSRWSSKFRNPFVLAGPNIEFSVKVGDRGSYLFTVSPSGVCGNWSKLIGFLPLRSWIVPLWPLGIVFDRLESKKSEKICAKRDGVICDFLQFSWFFRFLPVFTSLKTCQKIHILWVCRMAREKSDQKTSKICPFTAGHNHGWTKVDFVKDLKNSNLWNREFDVQSKGGWCLAHA